MLLLAIDIPFFSMSFIVNVRVIKFKPRGDLKRDNLSPLTTTIIVLNLFY